MDVYRERMRQIDVEGYTPEHDDQFTEWDELIRAADAYLLLAMDDEEGANKYWPWSEEWVKDGEPFTHPKDGGKRRSLVKAAALILAEIERIDRSKP